MSVLESGTNCNPKTCVVCRHPDRAEIEALILSMSPNNPTLTLDLIANQYGVSSEDLRRHALMHTPLALDFSKESEDALVANFKHKAGVDACDKATEECKTPVLLKNRLNDAVNVREGDMLLAAANEYLGTMSTLGRRIKRYASDQSEDSDRRLAAFCTNSVVNLYISCGTELRKAIDGIKELNTSLNGSQDSASAGLQALAAALATSKGADDTSDEAQFLDTETIPATYCVESQDGEHE